MKIKESDKKVYQAMDLIIAKGGQQIYNTYIKQKLPNHTYQGISKTIENFFNPSYINPSGKQKITKSSKPSSIKVDQLTPKKVSYRYKSIQGQSTQKKSRVRYKSQNNFQTFKNNPSLTSSYKPNICIKFMCRKVDDHYEQQQKMRNKKQRQVQKQQEKLMQKRRNQLKTKERQKRIRNTMRQLNQIQIPVTYDDQGTVIVPKQFLQEDEKEREKKMKSLKNSKQLWKKKLDQNNVIDIKFQTIGHDSKQLVQSKTKNLTGKKKGFSSSGKYYKKVKLSDRDYNNNNQRQYSTIPFVSLSEGVKLVQQQKNVTASKTKQSQCTRQSFIRQNKKFFKSYMPDSDYISAISMSNSRIRPQTADNFKTNDNFKTADNFKTKRTTQTKFGRQTKRSILWRPQSSKKQRDKISINNQEIAKEITYL